jgi:hypothetical protein
MIPNSVSVNTCHPSQEGVYVDTPSLFGSMFHHRRAIAQRKPSKIKNAERLVIYQKLESLLRTSRDRYLKDKLLKTYSRYKLGMAWGLEGSYLLTPKTATQLVA